MGRSLLPFAVATVLAQVGAVLLLLGWGVPVAPPPSPPRAVQAVAPVVNAGVRADGGAAAPLGYSVPVRLRIDRLGIDTGLMTLGLNPDQTVEVPSAEDPHAPAGWYRNLASPGEQGPSVILGHVTARGGAAAVFYRLGAARPGDHIFVRRADGRTAQFAVTRIAVYPRAAFPTQEVYGPVDEAALRLITCAGRYDPKMGSYPENVVVFARLSGWSSKLTVSSSPAVS